jgi:diguanylate cyclase (GGDEF)-like protein
MADILLLNADHAEAENFRLLVLRWGYTCAQAANSAAARQALHSADAPSILVLDHATVRRDSTELAMHLGDLQAERPLQVLVLADEYLRKPLDAAELRGKLQLAARTIALRTELAQAAQALRFFTSHDSLTALAHRQTAIQRLQVETHRAMRTHAPVSLLLMDVDGFRQLNSDHGQEAGDAVLREIGARLRRLMRGYDFAARYGADEFLVLLPECCLADAARLAVRLQHQLFSNKFAHGSQQLSLSGCFAVTESFGRTAAELLPELEAALTAARRKGPATVECAQDPGIHARLHLAEAAATAAPRAQEQLSFTDSGNATFPIAKQTIQ